MINPGSRLLGSHRRKFRELHVAHPSLERIEVRYASEAEIRGSTPEIRRAVRLARARTLLDSMQGWLEATLVSS